MLSSNYGCGFMIIGADCLFHISNKPNFPLFAGYKPDIKHGRVISEWRSYQGKQEAVLEGVCIHYSINGVCVTRRCKC